MIFTTDIDLNGHIESFTVDFNYYNDNNNVTIYIDSIKDADLYIELNYTLSDECLQLIKEKCRIHYENLHFEYYFMNDRNL